MEWKIETDRDLRDEEKNRVREKDVRGERCGTHQDVKQTESEEMEIKIEVNRIALGR